MKTNSRKTPKLVINRSKTNSIPFAKVTILFALTIIYLSTPSCYYAPENKGISDESLRNEYSSYFNSEYQNINSLSTEKTKNRKDAFTEIQTTTTYKSLVDRNIVLPKYLHVLNALGNGIKSSTRSTFTLTDEVESLLSADEKKFVLDAMKLYYAGVLH